MSFIDLHTNVSLGHTKITGLGGEKLWLCPTLGGDKLDISGNGNHGTYYGGMGTVADTSEGGSRAYLLDGSNTQRIECPASAIGSEPIISVSCWGYVNVHDASYGEGLVSQFGAGNNSTTCKFVVNASNGGSSSIFPSVGIRPSTTNVSAVSTNAISAQSWHHFCLVADGSTIYNYVDGVLEASTAYTGSVRSVTNPLVIGTYNQLINSNHYLNGRIDDVRAFNRALSTTEITHLASKRGVLGSPRNPVIKKRRIFYAPTAPVTTTAKAVVLKKPKPSYATGYAKNASESANPNLWKGLVGAWMPSFGVTGKYLYDLSQRDIEGRYALGDGNVYNFDPAISWVVSNSKQGINLNGANQNIRNIVEMKREAFTIEVEFEWDDFNTNNVAFLTAGTLERLEIHLGGIGTNGVRFIPYRPYGYGMLDVQNAVTSGINHFVFTANHDETSKFYKNGAFNSESSAVGSSNSILGQRFFYIGSRLNGKYHLDGKIFNVKIWNRVLKPSEIKQLYLNPSAPFKRKQQTVGISTAQAFNPYWGNQATQLAGTLQ